MLVITAFLCLTVCISGKEKEDSDFSRLTHLEDAEIRRLKHEWSGLRASAASSSNMHLSAAAAKVLHHEARMKQLRATIWNKSNMMLDGKQNITLSTARDKLYHQLHTDSSLSLEERAYVNEKLVQVMKQLGKQRMVLRAELEKLQKQIANLPKKQSDSHGQGEKLLRRQREVRMELNNL